MKTIFSFLTRSVFVRTAIVACLFLLGGLSASAQSETHNFITYDTTFRTGTGAAAVTWTMRISRPVNMFTANHPDTASRPLILTMPGQGEVGTNPANLARYGPHYWMNNGWDGSVTLGNGKHYPIIITVISSAVNPRAPQTLPLLQHILNTYRIKRNSVHLAGLSMGGFTWGKLLVYAEYPGDERAMSMITSLTALQGVSNEVFAPYNAWTMPGWSAYGQWAKKYNGKFFGLEGTSDTRKVWSVRDAMDLEKPGNAYFAFENIGGGAHCCWNSMYDPKVTDWSATNPNIINNTQHPNTMGTYKKGSSIFQWMLRQGDTTLVGSGQAPNVSPIVDAGPAQNITLPTNTVQLNGTASDPDGSITTYAWTKVAGPAQFTFSSTSIANPVFSNLASGTYKLRLTVTDNRGASIQDSVNVIVNAPPPPPPTTGGQAIQVRIYNGSNPYNNTQWNNWNLGTATTNLVSTAFKYTDGTSSTVKATLSQSTAVGDNSATYSGGMAPAEVLRYTSYSTMSRTLTLTGLAPSKEYQIELFGSRNSTANNKTIFSAGSAKDTVLTDNNHTEKGILTVSSDNTGKIVIALNRTNVYTYLNGFSIIDPSAASGRVAATATATETAATVSTLDVFPNPFQDRVVLQVNTAETGAMKVQLIDMNGVVRKEFNLVKNQAGAMQSYLSAGNLPAGEYILHVTIGKWTESKKVTRL